MQKTTTKLACVLDYADLQQRKGMLWKFFSQANQRKELKNGFEFSFDPAAITLAELAKVVDLERTCCTFLRFIITIEPAGGPLRLELAGPDGTKEFLASHAAPTPGPDRA